MSLRATPITFLVCVALLIGFILDAADTSISASLVLYPPFVTGEGQVWRLVTYPLVPGSLSLFLIGIAVLLYFGRGLELRIERWRYLMLCVLPSIAAAVVYLFIPNSGSTKPALASPHFISSGIALAALAFAIALRHYNFKSLKTWVFGLAAAYYLYAVLVAPRDLRAMNLTVFLVAGALVFRQVRNARAA
jgi:membrane associated rhomboid family serine protease